METLGRLDGKGCLSVERHGLATDCVGDRSRSSGGVCCESLGRSGGNTSCMATLGVVLLVWAV